MTLEFDPSCSTVQPEDSLQLYVPSLDLSSKGALPKHFDIDDSESPPFPYWPVLHKFTSW